MICLLSTGSMVLTAQDVVGIMPTVPVLRPNYNSFTGTVTEILPSDRSADAAQRIMVEGENGEPCMFVINPDTVWASYWEPNTTAVNVGDRVTGFYNTSAPMIMIYPPQYNIEIMIVDDPERGMEVTVDRLSETLHTSDGKIQIKIGEHIQVLTQDGEMFRDESGFAGRLVIVFHNPVDDSIPAQALAWKIIVLYEKIMPLPIEIETTVNEETLVRLNSGEIIIGNVEEMDIVVNNETINAPRAYMKDGTVMVPLRYIAEALGFQVQWERATRSIMLGRTISLSIGNDYYTYARMAPITLGMAPELKDGITFVPLNFFTEVARMNNAYVSEGQIVINQ